MRIIDLSRELYHRTPSYPGQPPIIHGVWKTHEEAFAESGNVHGNSVMYFSMPDHGGTHIDAPRHFGKEGHADRRVPAGELHRAGHLHRPAPHRAARGNHAGGSRSGGEEDGLADPEGRHGPALHRPPRAHVSERRLYERQSGRERRGDRVARAARHRAFRHRLDAAGARRAWSTRWCTRPASSSASPTSRACAISKRCSAAGEFQFIGLPLKWRGGTGSPIRAVAVFERRESPIGVNRLDCYCAVNLKPRANAERQFSSQAKAAVLRAVIIIPFEPEAEIVFPPDAKR